MRDIAKLERESFWSSKVPMTIIGLYEPRSLSKTKPTKLKVIIFNSLAIHNNMMSAISYCVRQRTRLGFRFLKIDEFLCAPIQYQLEIIREARVNWFTHYPVFFGRQELKVGVKHGENKSSMWRRKRVETSTGS